MIYITGDTHGDFGTRLYYLDRFSPAHNDTLIILGDAGINFNLNESDYNLKKELAKEYITFFCVHGNHEARPFTIPSYREVHYRGAVAYQEPEFPNLIFAKDGEIYDFDGKKTIVIGGAYSVDKEFRLTYGWQWFPDEQPSAEIKRYVEQQLDVADWNVDVVLSHTVPFKYLPVEYFSSSIDQSRVDRSTEEWLDMIEDRLAYRKWYAGHFHCEKKIDKLRILAQDIILFSGRTQESYEGLFESYYE